MKVRITFRSEIYLEGEDMKEIVRKWDCMELFSKEANEAGACEIEVVTVEDAETFDDVMDEFDDPWKDEEDEMIFPYKGGYSMMKFFNGEDGITVELPDEGLTGTFDNVKDLAYDLAPIVTNIGEKHTLAGMLSMWFGENEEEVLEWLMK